jgi:hypothetical protein
MLKLVMTLFIPHCPSKSKSQPPMCSQISPPPVTVLIMLRPAMLQRATSETAAEAARLNRTQSPKGRILRELRRQHRQPRTQGRISRAASLDVWVGGGLQRACYIVRANSSRPEENATASAAIKTARRRWIDLTHCACHNCSVPTPGW